MIRTIMLTAMLAAPAYAGGPVITPEEPELTEPARDRDNLLPLILGLIVVGAVVLGSDSADPGPTKPVCKGGC